ncbi:hypothetical protein KII97_02340 [Leuconostoc gelidum subsp. gasicomitatum]|uniref:hypothetical protein n=1 Tax=Leuconostoc gasicomitatum TaxID=115778 RepID=UPI001CC460E8|nr:hypothetical protein [Leuconostoc gasicomitatum]MBZ5995347.1 hypothetical protein [Leuconostoc gasicomitatum]
MAIDWTKRPPLVENTSLLGNGKAIYAAPDGDKTSARMLVGADGFHFMPSDFEDFAFPKITLSSSENQYDLSFNDVGSLLINGSEYTTPTNQSDEDIGGNKTFTGNTKLSGGAQLLSPNGGVFNITIDDDGNIKTEKEVIVDNGQIGN